MTTSDQNTFNLWLQIEEIHPGTRSSNFCQYERAPLAMFNSHEELRSFANTLFRLYGSDDEPPAKLAELSRALRQILDYLWDDETSNYQADASKHHIFNALKVLRDWLDEDPYFVSRLGEDSEA